MDYKEVNQRMKKLHSDFKDEEQWKKKYQYGSKKQKQNKMTEKFFKVIIDMGGLLARCKSRQSPLHSSCALASYRFVAAP